MRDVVHWESIIGRDFMEKFTAIAKAEYFAVKNDTPMAKVVDKVGNEDYERYRKKRRQMRDHGWFQSYITSRGNLKFMTIHDPRTSHYITLSEYINKRDADRIVLDEEEYYAARDMIQKTLPIMLPGVNDEDFPKERTV